MGKKCSAYYVGLSKKRASTNFNTKGKKKEENSRSRTEVTQKLILSNVAQIIHWGKYD